MLTLVCISIQQFDASLDIEGCPIEIGEIAVVHLQYFVAVDLVDEERMKKEKEKEKERERERAFLHLPPFSPTMSRNLIGGEKFSTTLLSVD
jgi:hypothetical protein